jgi:hypothetical protein
LTTRDETARLLMDFGVSVVLEDVQGWGVLKCKVDDVTGPPICFISFT